MIDERIVPEAPPVASECLRCTLPNGHQHASVIAELQEKLVEHFGGFTSYDMRGGWAGPAGQVIEQGTIYEASYEFPDHSKRTLGVAMFLRAGRDMGENYTRVEIHKIGVILAKTNKSAAEREENERQEALRRRERKNRPWDASGH